MKKLTHLLKKYWFLALLASGFMVAEVYVDLYQPRMMQLIVDEGILGLSSNGVSNLNLVISTGIRMLLIVLFGGLCGIGSALFTNVTGQGYGNDIRKACLDLFATIGALRRESDEEIAVPSDGHSESRVRQQI